MSQENKMSVMELLTHLMRGGAYGHYWNKQRNETLWWPGATPPPVPEEWAGDDVYFGVNPAFKIPEKNSKGELAEPHRVRSQNRVIQTVNAIIADMDSKDYGGKIELAQHIKTLRPLPSVIIDSGGGYHCYWLLEAPVGPKEAGGVQRGWPGLVGGDEQAKDLARVLRVPGTFNHKPEYDEPLPVKFVWQSRRRHTLDELREALDERVEEGQPEDALPPAYYYDGQRNRDLLNLAGALARKGATEKVMYAALKARSVEQHKPPLDDDRIQKIAQTANWPKSPEMLTAPANDEGNAQCFVLLFGGQFLHTPQTGWLFYNGKYWERNEYLAQYCMLRTLETRKLAVKRTNNFEAHKDVYGAAKEVWGNVRDALQLAKLRLVAEWTSFDSDPDILNCANGVLRLKAGDVVAHSHDQRFTYCLETAYDPEAECPQWTKFLGEVLVPEGGEDKGMLDYVQTAMGYSITGHTREEILFYLVGPTRSGKGTFTETFRALLGSRLSWEVAFSTFSGRRRAGDQNFDLAPLRTVRYVAASEGARTQKLNEAFIKRITGGNAVSAAFKHQTSFNYRPMYKIWLSSNYEPSTDPGDDGVWGRLKVVRFPNSYLHREDKLLKTRLRQPGELRGILTWLVEGTMKWYALGGQGLATPKCVQEAVDESREAVDYVAMWAEACIEETGDPQDFIVSSRYHQSYKRWYDEEGIGGGRRMVRGQTAVTRDLRRLGYTMSEKGRTFRDPVTKARGRGLVGYVISDKPGPGQPITIGDMVI